MIEGSTVELEGEEHWAVHSADGDFVRWGRLGGLETLRRYGRPWFSLLGSRRWKKVSEEQLTEAFSWLTRGTQSQRMRPLLVF